MTPQQADQLSVITFHSDGQFEMKTKSYRVVGYSYGEYTLQNTTTLSYDFAQIQTRPETILTLYFGGRIHNYGYRYQVTYSGNLLKLSLVDNIFNMNGFARLKRSQIPKKQLGRKE